MNGETLRIALELIATDATGGAFSSLAANVMRAGYLMRGVLGSGVDETNAALVGKLIPATLGAGVAFMAFGLGMKYAVETGAALQQAGVMASIAISDGAQHVGELEDAIIQLANNSQYKIADVDQAFRVLGGLGFTTGQILGGMGQQAIFLAQALGGPGGGVNAADAARLLGQALYIFGGQGLTAKMAADELTGAYYNNMMSVSSLTEFMGMAGGTASALGENFGSLLTMGSLLTPMFGSASSAGASLSYMMRNLAHPSTAKMADEIKKLGLHVYNAQGQFVGLKSVMDQLFTATAGMTQQQKMDVFGTLFNVRSGRAAMDLMSETQAQFDSSYSRIYGRIMTVGQAQRDSNAINNSAIGTWHRLTTTINDFFAKAGELIDTALLPLMNALNGLFSTLQKSPQVEKFFAAFLVAGTILSAVALIVGVVTVAILLFGSALAIAAGVFGGIIAVAALAGAAFVYFSGHARQGSAILHAFGVAISAVRSVLGGLGSIVLGLADQFIFFFKGFLDGFHAISGFVGPLLHQVMADFARFAAMIGGIGGTAVRFLTQSLRHLGTALAGLAPIGQDVLIILHALGAALGFVAGIISSVLLIVLEAVGIALIALWNGIVATLSGVITVISGILQVLIGIFKMTFGALIALVTGHTAQAKAIFLDGWNNIKSGALDIVRGLAMAIVGLFTGLLGTIIALVGGLVTGVVRWFQHLLDVIVGHSIIPDLVNAIVRWFEQLPGRVGAAISAFVASVISQASTLPGRFMSAIASLPGRAVGVFRSLGAQVLGVLNGLAGQMFASGSHLVGNLVSGIQSMAGAVGNAVAGIAGKIASLLHHSVPREGPLADELDWMPHMMANLAQGIHSNLPLIDEAATRAATTISGAFTSPQTLSVQGSVAAHNAAANGPVQQFTVPLEVDGKVLAEAFYEVVGGQLRMNGMSRIGRG